MLGRLQARSAHRTDLAYCQQRWRRSSQSVRGRKPSLRQFPAPSPTQVAPLSPASALRLSTKALGLKRNALTDTAGQYRFAGLPTGNYSLRMEKTGFQSQVREGVELNSAVEVTINSQLAIGDISQQTTVSANVAGIDNTTSTISGLLPEQSLAELPLDNRDLFSAVALEPGVAPNPSSGPSLLSSGKSGQVAINGSRPSMTNVLIDGMDATDPVLGYSPAGASGFFLGLNELAEVRVLTQTFNAEYGGHGAAVIEMTTKSGSNQFHGSLWELHRDASLDAKNYFDLGDQSDSAFRPQSVRCWNRGATEA